jgi:hypothetical protein
MRHRIGRLALAALFVVGVSGLVAHESFANAHVHIVNNDGPNEGFNDPTPAAPVGGNTGTTIGQQRLNVFQFAADVWGATLDSDIDIFVDAQFNPLSCTATAAVLGSAGTTSIFTDFGSTGLHPGPVGPNLWHHTALAEKRSGLNLNGSSADIRARFNSSLGQTGCLTGIFWYYGLDGLAGNNIDLAVVVLHELAHGLGFSQFASVSDGSQILDMPDVYNRNLLDLTTGKHWNDMTNAERAASSINSRKVVWTGPEVTAAVPGVLAPGTPFLRLEPGSPLTGTFEVGTASFGPRLTSPGLTGQLALGLDGTPPAGNACEPITSAVVGKIAVVDRGTCTFVTKTLNAQAAGAIGVIVVDNVAGGPPPGLGGADPTITIPAVRVTLADGNAIKAAMASGTVTATIGVDLAQRSGADVAGRAIMNAPNPVQPGSSISHWDPIAFPNQLMEPAINSDLTHNVQPPYDMTLPLLRDVGWFADADNDGIANDVDCEANSDLSATLSIQGCDAGVPNPLFTTGCTLSDLIAHIGANAPNHGQFMKGVGQLVKDLISQHVLTVNQREGITECAAASDYGQGHAIALPSMPAAANGELPARQEIALAGANPGRGGTSLQLALPRATRVEVRIHDVRGGLVWKMDPREFSAGTHLVSWDGKNRDGNPAAAGVYFVQVATPERMSQLRFVMIR